MKRRFTILTAALALLVSLAIPMGMRGQTTTTYTFSSKSWEASPANWTSGKDGNQFTSGRGVQVTAGASGANATSPVSFTNISKVEVTYSTNANAGAGSISIQVGSNTAKSENVTKTGGTTDRVLTYNYSPMETGNVKLTVTCSTNSIYVKSIAITTSTGGGTPTTPSNLALTGAPISLTFDLYNNSSAQTISYTTSSTGTVSVQENDYVTATVDQQNKTITVTPKAITNGNQTIIVNQAADATYLAGSKTFTVNITDSTPGVVFIAGTDLGSTTGNNSSDEMTKDVVTIYSTDAAFASDPYKLYQNSVTTISVPAGYKITSIVFTGQSTSYPVDRLSTTNGTYSVSNNVGTWTGNSSSVTFSASAQARASRIRVVVEQDNTPTIAVSPASLNAFSYLSTSATPSAAQTVSVSGANLSANITVALGNNSDFEISLAENSDYTNSLTLAQTNGTVGATTIYVRMKSGLSAGSHNDNLALSSTGATSINIELSGSVIAPMTVAQAIAAIDEASNNEVEGAYVSGIVCQVDSYNSQFHSITYWISDDGETTTKLQAYSGKDLNGDNFSSINDLMVGDEVVVFGNLQIHEGIYEFNYNNYLVSFNRPEPEPFTLTVSNLLNVEVFVFNAADLDNPLLNGEGSTSINNGTSVLLSVTAEAGYIMESLVVDGADVTSSIVDDAYTFTMPRRAVTVTATAVIAPLYTVTLCDDQTALTEVSYGAGVTLPSRSGNTTYTFAGWSTTNVGGTETTTAPTSIIPAGLYHPTQNIILYPVYTRIEAGSGTATEWHLVSLADIDEGVYALLTNDDYAFNGTISSGHGQSTESTFEFDDNDVATSVPSDLLEITFEPVEVDGMVVGYKLHDLSNNRYLYATKAGSGGLAWHDSEDNYWKYDNTNNVENLIYNKSYSESYAHLRCYNNTFRTYAGNNNNGIKLAKKVEGSSGTTYYTSLLSTYTTTINGYGENSNPGGYYLIASPFGTINPANVTGMLSDTYDLYYFDQEGDNDGNEWINYKGGSFNLEPGTGYLYAHNSTITLNFTGTPIEGTTYDVTLTKNERARFKGWNLVGNPFTKTAYVDNTHNAYYTMDGDGALFVPVTGNSVDPMEGIFVVANSDGETITFSTTNPNEVKCSTLALNLSQGQSLLDRAIVRFDEGSQLPKLQFNRNSSKVCIPMDDEDYAVVRAEEMGEMPVNFKAESNGTYSLNFGMDNVEFAYLHLIDNLTGNEVDLLQTPSYSFEAKTTDYESRFKLVFATGDNSNEDNFAYFSNGSFVINNEGNATLQVIDITGRIVKSETVNGCANVNVNGAAGVYMLRLVNGDNVKVQKVVVK